MRSLIATVFNYSVDGLLADQGTEYWDFCFSLPENSRPDDPAQLDFIRRADAHLMGRTTYEGMSEAMTAKSPEHPFAGILTAGRKVVFSHTLTSVDWANTTIAAGDTRQAIEELRRGGGTGTGSDGGYLIVWGGVSFFRSLMQLDLIDELHVSMYPYIAGEGTRLFDGVPKSYQLDLVSSAASPSGIVELRYLRNRPQ
jgi:dihydrofolate reductase